MRKARVVFSLLLILFTVSLLLPQPAQAQSTACPPESSASGSVVVQERNADITILESGDVRYVETWVVDFLGTGFQFAFRSIPLNKATAITDWSVSEAGTMYERSSRGQYVYTLDSGGGERKITWCFPPTSNQTRTFTLSYTVKGSIAIYDQGDRYFWTFVEDDRGYTIERSTVRVHLPAEFPADQLELAGFVNEFEELTILSPGDNSLRQYERSAGRIVDGDTIEFTGGPFFPGDTWEIGVRFPHGVVASDPPTWQFFEDMRPLLDVVGMGLIIILLVAGGAGLYIFWYTLGRDRPAGVQAEFIPRPPGDLRPGIAGILLDEMADMEDIMATLIDLARRGYLQIVETEKSGFGRKSDFIFIRENLDQNPLQPYEKKLLSAVFGGRKQRELSSLKNKFYTSLPAIRKLMYEDLTGYGYFQGNPETVRQRFGCMGAVVAAAVGFIAWLLYGLLTNIVSEAIAFCLPASLMLFPIGSLVMARFMPRKTQKGARAAAQWGAFKRYLSNVEKYTTVENAKDQFEQYLPYAIAFGLEKSWVRTFSQTDTAIPGWYWPYGWGRPFMDDDRRSGSGGGVAGRPAPSGGGAPSLDDAAGKMFGGLESMSTGLFTMLDQAASTFTSAPSSSGSGGGGGFSGGGGGGGGSSGFG